MTMHERERSSRIVAEATRIIELSAQIDAALDQAERLDRERIAAAVELAGLAGVDLGARQRRIASPAIEHALNIIRSAGDEGIPAGKLAKRVGKTTGRRVIEKDLQDDLRPFHVMGDIRLNGNLYRPGNGRANRQRTKKQLGLPTDTVMVLEVLRASPEPMGIRAIMDAVKERFGETIPRTSISPLLRKLDDKGGTVVHVGDRWAAVKA